MDNKKHTNCCEPDTTIEQLVKTNGLSGGTISTFSVSGMDCADEVAAIQKSLRNPLIGKISANLIASEIVVEHDPALTKNEIAMMINSSGVKVKEAGVVLTFYTDNKSRVWIVSFSGVILTLGLLAQWLTDSSKAVLFFPFFLSSLAGFSLILPKAFRSLRQKSLDMNVLMTLAVTGAFFIQEFSEGAAVVFLFSLAEMLEAFSISRARRAIREVLSITPQTATVEMGKGSSQVQVELVNEGQIVVILAGDRIPLDGEVIEGRSSVNQAPLTGESRPVAKAVGDLVLAGTINESGTLKVKVRHTFKDSKISNIIRLIEEAQNKKALAQLFVDKFSRVYTPVVTLVAVLVAILPPLYDSGGWNLWFYRSLVFLVIACPCALVIATPVSIVSALTALARTGVLVKGGVYLETLGKIRALAVDKTGTITEGVPKVVSFKVLNSGSQEELLNVVQSLTMGSTHPLARAAASYCEQKMASPQEVHDFKVIQGKGIEGRVGEHLYFAGNHRLVHEMGVCSPEIEAYLARLEDQAQSVMVVGHRPHSGCAGEVIGILGLADEPRSNVVEAIRGLHRVGIREISMLSGDNQRTVNSIAKRVGIDSAQGDLLPEDKVREIQKLMDKHKYVGMVGDGINDAPALAQATIGIAMGAAGTDAAIETADVALMTDDLSQLARAVCHGRRTLNIIRFNIGIALATKSVFIVLGAFGYSSLWLAVAADMGATLIVIGNSVRLLRA
jgi:Cd2+/Zn2+-exporting ATPase